MMRSGREGTRTPKSALTDTDSQSDGLTDVQPFHSARGLAKKPGRDVNASRPHLMDAPNAPKLSHSFEFERIFSVRPSSVNHGQINGNMFEFEPQVVIKERDIVWSNEKS